MTGSEAMWWLMHLQLFQEEVGCQDDIDATITLSKNYMTEHNRPLSPEHLEDLERHVQVARLRDLKLDEPGKIGYTFKCLGAAVWSLRQAIFRAPKDDAEKAIVFKELITTLTMHAGDADTNCAAAGALLGAYLTLNGLPGDWRKELIHADWLLEKVDAAASLLGVRLEPYDFGSDNDTLIDGGKGELSREDIDRRAAKLVLDMEDRIQAQMSSSAALPSSRRNRRSLHAKLQIRDVPCLIA